jgi:peptidyl-prolyl cis-trans isomerase SurA
MKFYCCTAVLLCAALYSAPAQVSSHAPTPIASVNASAPAPNTQGPSPSMQVTGKPVVRINGVELTDRDLLREMLDMFPYARVHNGFPRSQEVQIRDGAMKMIEYEELVYQEAERRKMTISRVRLDRAEAEYRNRFASQDDFNQYLKTEMGGSREKLRHQIRRSLLIDAMLKAEVGDKSKVSLLEARNYYTKNPKRFQHGELFAFQTISIMPPENANADVKKKALQRAQDALKQAKATKTYEEFGLLAQKMSDDDFRVKMGDHKLVPREQLPPAMLKAALSMKPGQVSDLLSFGPFYTLFRLNAHIPAGKVPFEEIKPKLLSDLEKVKYDQLRERLDKRLRQSAKVQEL